MIQAVQYLICGILWIGSSILTIVKKNPIGIIFLTLLHGAEAVLIGVKTGLEYGKKLPYSIVMCMTFGFTWWLPLKQQMKAETFTDDDFIRRPDDCIVDGKGGLVR